MPLPCPVDQAGCSVLPFDAEPGQGSVQDLGRDGRDRLAALDCQELEPIKDPIGQAQLPPPSLPTRGDSPGASPGLCLSGRPPPALLGPGLVVSRLAGRRLRLRRRCRRPDQRRRQLRNSPLIRHDRVPPLQVDCMPGLASSGEQIPGPSGVGRVPLRPGLSAG